MLMKNLPNTNQMPMPQVSAADSWLDMNYCLYDSAHSTNLTSPSQQLEIEMVPGAAGKLQKVQNTFHTINDEVSNPQGLP